MSLKAAKEALQRKRYTEAIALLQAYCEGHPQVTAPDFIQAQMWMVNAWQRSGRPDKAILICEQLALIADPQIQDWATKCLTNLQRSLGNNPLPIESSQPKVTAVIPSKGNRYRRRNVALSLGLGYLWMQRLASAGTVLMFFSLLLGGWYFILSRFVLVITTEWWGIVGGLTCMSGILCFFMAPWLIDISQKRYQRVQWITLSDLELRSPESAETIQLFCDARNRDIPRLGWIDADQPVAFCYGVLPNSVRIVLSRGVFEVLDDDEVAAVVAQLLGRVVCGSCFIVTLGALPAQLFFMLFVWLERGSFQLKQGKTTRIKFTLARLSKWMAFIVHGLFHFSHYLVAGLLRTTTYPNDRFAAEVTGNPNALMRALPKMARGLASGIPHQMQARILESTRCLGVYDYQTCGAIGIAFEILYAQQSDKNLFEVFLWELVNPWAQWLECHGTHPLMAKRLQQLTLYGQQLGLTPEYGFDQLMLQTKKLSRRQLYHQFRRDLLIQVSPWAGTIGAYLLSEVLNVYLDLYSAWLSISLVTITFSVGLMFQGALRYPDYRRVRDTDLVSLLIDPYASAVAGEPVQFPGELLSYSANWILTYQLKLEDQGGVMVVNHLAKPQEWYVDRLATIQQLEQLAGESVIAVGWYRRFSYPMVDLALLKPLVGKAKTLRSYHAFWNNITTSVLLMIGLLLLSFTALL